MTSAAALFCCVMTAHGAERATFQASVEDLAKSSGLTVDPAFLIGIGQVYCQMKEVVGQDTDLWPDTLLAVLHQKHPETQPKSKVERDVQWKTILLANGLLCPERPWSPEGHY